MRTLTSLLVIAAWAWTLVLPAGAGAAGTVTNPASAPYTEAPAPAAHHVKKVHAKPAHRKVHR